MIRRTFLGRVVGAVAALFGVRSEDRQPKALSWLNEKNGSFFGVPEYKPKWGFNLLTKEPTKTGNPDHSMHPMVGLLLGGISNVDFAWDVVASGQPKPYWNWTSPKFDMLVDDLLEQIHLTGRCMVWARQEVHDKLSELHFIPTACDIPHETTDGKEYYRIHRFHHPKFGIVGATIPAEQIYATILTSQIMPISALPWDVEYIEGLFTRIAQDHFGRDLKVKIVRLSHEETRNFVGADYYPIRSIYPK